jgi:hypothetical protein
VYDILFTGLRDSRNGDWYTNGSGSGGSGSGPGTGSGSSSTRNIVLLAGVFRFQSQDGMSLMPNWMPKFKKCDILTMD